jgi:hypothetical protein
MSVSRRHRGALPPGQPRPEARAFPSSRWNSRHQRCSTFRVHLKRPCGLGRRGPISKRRVAASLHSGMNFLRDRPMTQFSMQGILSHHWSSHIWGQIQAASRRQVRALNPILSTNTCAVLRIRAVFTESCHILLPAECRPIPRPERILQAALSSRVQAILSWWIRRVWCSTQQFLALA